MKVFGLENPTEMKAFAMSIDFLMMLCVLVRIDAMCIGISIVFRRQAIVHCYMCVCVFSLFFCAVDAMCIGF